MTSTKSWRFGTADASAGFLGETQSDEIIYYYVTPGVRRGGVHFAPERSVRGGFDRIVCLWKAACDIGDTRDAAENTRHASFDVSFFQEPHHINTQTDTQVHTHTDAMNVSCVEGSNTFKHFCGDQLDVTVHK